MNLAKDELDFLNEVSKENAAADFIRWVELMESEYGSVDSPRF